MGTNCDRGEVDKEAWKALLIKKKNVKKNAQGLCLST